MSERLEIWLNRRADLELERLLQKLMCGRLDPEQRLELEQMIEKENEAWRARQKELGDDE